jgi:hypothetical protein
MKFREKLLGVTFIFLVTKPTVCLTGIILILNYPMRFPYLLNVKNNHSPSIRFWKSEPEPLIKYWWMFWK